MVNDVVNAAAMKKKFSDALNEVVATETKRAAEFYNEVVIPKIESEGNNGWNDAKIDNITTEMVDIHVLSQYLNGLGYTVEVNCFDTSIHIMW